ncbi:pyrimidine dimer DNA glycosylase/endonuclease V [Georgenia sp. 10Sc9-8]|uniref:Pyrimidine dimer DNA glycosylase/endonuclease V n=1 Tax=Georgenia halotolerans TaxID=3028317 RepID=A0ABT5TVN8_9MICO|nr:pyrimidine dimer DNA glycosylase/endonuclease V [Georgenia halotolerans]
MRLWSLHPRYLDRQGLTACWREALLAQAVLTGRTRGYRNHPQLERFREQPEPDAAVGSYLTAVAEEAAARGYRFDTGKILSPGVAVPLVAVTDGQVALEWRHLLAKLRVRSPDRAGDLAAVTDPLVHPLFRVVPGPVAGWERDRGTTLPD